MNRRLLIIITAVIVLLGLAVGAYFLFANKPSLTVGVPNPFGSSGDQSLGGDTFVGDGPVQGAGVVVAPRLIKVTDGPVAKGAVALYIPPVVSTTSATSTVETAPADIEVRYVERQSGNIYAFRVHDRVLTRISNRTLPGVQEASWAPDGSRVFARYIARATDGTERVDTYALPSDGSEGYFLEPGVSQVVVGSTTVFSLLPSTSGSLGTLAALDGTGARTLFSSAISALRGGFFGGDFMVTTKASANIDGYAFFVSRANGSFTRALGPLRGLATLPNPDGSSVLYSYNNRGKQALEVLDWTARAATPLPLVTLAEKCVWAPGGRAVYCGVPTALGNNLPDEWYQGARAFSDRIWRIDLNTRLATLIVDPAQVGDVAIDAVALAVDPEEDVLVFTNKTDGSLWTYDL